MEENYDELFLAVTKVRNNHKLYKADFNVLTTFLRPSNEVELHSRFITWLLDPRAPHKLGELPLKLFLLQIGSQFTVSDTTKVTPNAINWTEDRDMDILIYDKKQKFAIVIENKIFASDSDHGEDDGQLARYFYQVQRGKKVQNGKVVSDKKTYFQSKNIELYYLTIDGHKPSNLTFKKIILEVEKEGNQDRKRKIRLLKYNEQIAKWLDEVLKTTNPSPLVEELILEYKDALYCVSPYSALNVDLANIFNENDTLRENLKTFIGDYKSLEGLSFDQKGEFFREKFKDDSLVDAAVFLLSNYRHIYWHALNDFFIKLQDELHSIFDDNLLLREKDQNTGKEKTIDRYVSEIIFEEKNASKLSPMYYRIRYNELEWTLQPNRAKGFFLGVDNTTEPNKDNESLSQLKSKLAENGYSADIPGWHAFKYLSESALNVNEKTEKYPLLNLWNFLDGDTFNLLNEDKRKKIALQYALFVKDELAKLN